jgi:quinolinate synthase
MSTPQIGPFSDPLPATPPHPDAPDIASVDPTLDLPAEIRRLKRQKNAVLLAHYYQEEEIQDLADFVGDSLDLSRNAQKSSADIIAFAGVRFMAETAKILNPSRKVVLPDYEAGCSLESSAPPELFRRWREAHPGAVSLTYINCSAAVKALSDIIVTSSNAEKIVRTIPPEKEILFAPDRHLGEWLVKKTGRPMTLWPGACIVHEQFSEREIVKLKARYPDALLAAHPECPDPILQRADHVGSTRSILNYATTAPGKRFLIATEEGIIHQMKKLAPDREYIPVPPDNGCQCNECPFMKLNTLEKLYLCLRDERPEIRLPEDLRRAAEKPLLRMLELS